jgi:DNA-binding transcriptional ArsR family regulator
MTVFQLSRIASFLKIFSNPIRLKIIFFLNLEGEKTVNELVEILMAKQCYVSQQVNYLTGKGILERRKDGHHVYYSLKNKEIINLLDLTGTQLTKNESETELQLVHK